MLKRFLAAAAALLAAAPAAAQTQAPPRLLIVISIDQLSADLFDEYLPHFTGGLARLASGVAFRNGYQSHAMTETCPGHSTILTGMRPARTGVIANTWIDQSAPRDDKIVYCAEDERAPGTTSTAYRAAPVHLKVPTLGEILRQRSPQSRSVAVAGKDRSAMMMGGPLPDQRWYWNGTRFTTDLTVTPPRSVALTNGAVASAIARARGPLLAPPHCAAKAQPVTLEGSGRVVGNGAFARSVGDVRGFRNGPEFDGAVLALSAALVQELGLGADASPDVLAISLAATDYVGHAYGIGGQEMCLQLLSLDRDLGDFLAVLDRARIDYAVALTADHGGDDIPERLRLRGVAGAARVDPALETRAVSTSIGRAGALLAPQRLGNFIGDVYVDRALAPDDRAQIMRDALSFYRRHAQVAAAYSAAEILATPMPAAAPDKWSLLEMARASFDERRSGDIVVMLKPHISPIVDTSTYASTHGSPWAYDRRVPILFWRSGMAASPREEPVETIDIMPTLAAMLGLPAPQVDGKCLRGIPPVPCPSR